MMTSSQLNALQRGGSCGLRCRPPAPVRAAAAVGLPESFEHLPADNAEQVSTAWDTIQHTVGQTAGASGHRPKIMAQTH